MIRNLKLVEKYLAAVLLFVLPTQLAFHFWPAWAFIFGIRVDLLAPALYLTDVIIVALFLLKVFYGGKFFMVLWKRKSALLIFAAFAVVNCVYSVSPPISVYRWLKIIEYLFVGYYFFKQDVFGLGAIVKTLFYSLITFSMIGIAQFIKGGTIGGPLYFLGERSFGLGTPGIALVSLNGVEHLRAYSTFSHPNSLAGFIGAAVLFILLSGKLKRSVFNLVGVLIILGGFILSFSISSYLGMFVSFAFFLFSGNLINFRKIIATFLFLAVVGSLVLPPLSSWIFNTFPWAGQNITQRLDLSYISGQIISRRFLIGTGLGTFIVDLPEFKGILSYSWLLQPVHNIFLLILSELGILGLLSLCFLIYKSLLTLIKKGSIYLILPIVFIVFTGLFDHYTLTLQQNTLLLCVFIGLSFRAKVL